MHRYSLLAIKFIIARMMSFNKSQITLASRLRGHNADRVKRKANESVVDLPISAEMIELLDGTLNQTDEDGYLTESVASIMAHPLNFGSTFCPTAEVLDAKHASNRVPETLGQEYHAETGVLGRSDTYDENRGTESINLPFSPTTHFSGMVTDTFRETNVLRGTPKSSGALSGTPKVSEAKSRLEVLWLRRKAELAKEDGDIHSAVNILEEAVKEHLGTTDYLSAKLSEPVLSNDPKELLTALNTEYFLYDTHVHWLVARMQRCFHRRYVFKCNMITAITKLYRGYLARKRMWHYRELRRQCAVLLQRRFRIHLERMHRLATKIKNWFRIRKIVHEYHRKLRIYQMARKIQRLYRGCKGRAVAGQLHRRLTSNMRIQRNARAYIVRRDRAYAIHLYHRIFFSAARVIQRFVRQQQAIDRSQMKLLLELARESVRARKERILVEETLRAQKAWDSFYTKSDAGRTHLYYTRRQMAVKRSELREVKVALTEDELMTQRVIGVLEQYDEDGAGNFDVRRLRRVLERLCIPPSREKLLHLREALDPQHLGYIGFTDFLEWFESEEADDLVEPESVLENLARLRLEARRRLRALHLHHHFRKTRKEQHRQHVTWLCKETVNTFRSSHPPKYQCCQCLQAFVLFTDYFTHFDGQSGLCGVTSERAMFFPKYWVKQDWAKQRQCEYEVIRVNDEHPYVRHHTRLQCFSEISLRSDPAVRRLQRATLGKAYQLYREQFGNVETKDLKKGTVKLLMRVVRECSGASASDCAADVIMSGLGLPMHRKWIVEEVAPVQELEQWLQEHVLESAAGSSEDDDGADQNKRGKADKKIKGGKKDKKGKRGKREEEGLEEEFSSTKNAYRSWLQVALPKPPSLTDSSIVKRRAWELAIVHLRLLRLLQVEAQAALLNLLEFRARRPRR